MLLKLAQEDRRIVTDDVIIDLIALIYQSFINHNVTGNGQREGLKMMKMKQNG
ncbi:hypothetical protein B4110_3217 [Parageobacillus toebii]|uniref:Uncharacterized protein n=1 Tax=Parageobacillus toebii TaxID=153151 RepID=A0A150MGB3_9BACL|nr:hypothetical protein B4110_3217 [Parageobacillus toebii]